MHEKWHNRGGEWRKRKIAVARIEHQCERHHEGKQHREYQNEPGRHRKPVLHPLFLRTQNPKISWHRGAAHRCSAEDDWRHYRHSRECERAGPAPHPETFDRNVLNRPPDQDATDERVRAYGEPRPR